ncbi:MAG: exosortase/archaeosortase family protein [Planctomycetia bacterium]|nr:exosortase/archaeosortase family protein [Planctomycetia bacterium]
MTFYPEMSRLRLFWPLAPLAIASISLLWAYWSTLGELAHAWNTNQQYGHGWLVPLFAAYLLYTRRDKLNITDLRPNLWGLGLLALGLVMRLAATYWYFISLDPISFVPCVAGLVLLFGGWAAFRWSWPAVLFLMFMIPLPFRVANMLAGPLQHFATVTSTFFMQILGLPALAEGNVILLNDHHIGIVEACSGLRMLVVFFALSTGVVLVIERHWIDKLVIFLSAIPIALLSNLFRVTATGIMYDFGFSELASHFFHDVAGWIMMPLALAMLWAEIKLLDVLFIDTPKDSRPAQGTNISRSPERRTTASTQPTRGNRSRRKAEAKETPQEQPAETSSK